MHRFAQEPFVASKATGDGVVMIGTQARELAVDNGRDEAAVDLTQPAERSNLTSRHVSPMM